MNQSSNTEWLTFKADPDMAGRINAARNRLLAAAPGVKVSKSSVLRHLLTLGAEISEKNHAPSAAPPI